MYYATTYYWRLRTPDLIRLKIYGSPLRHRPGITYFLLVSGRPLARSWPDMSNSGDVEMRDCGTVRAVCAVWAREMDAMAHFDHDIFWVLISFLLHSIIISTSTLVNTTPSSSANKDCALPDET